MPVFCMDNKNIHTHTRIAIDNTGQMQSNYSNPLLRKMHTAKHSSGQKIITQPIELKICLLITSNKRNNAK